MRGLAAAILVVGVAALAACGGDGGDELSAAELREQADAICADAEEKVEAIPEPQSLDDVETYLDRVVPIFRDQISRLQELNPPEELQEDWDRAMDLNEENLEAAEDAQQAAEDGDQEGVREALERGGRHEQELDRLAGRLGLQTCGDE